VAEKEKARNNDRAFSNIRLLFSLRINYLYGPYITAGKTIPGEYIGIHYRVGVGRWRPLDKYSLRLIGVIKPEDVAHLMNYREQFVTIAQTVVARVNGHRVTRSARIRG
jgi:hypothetical protein